MKGMRILVVYSLGEVVIKRLQDKRVAYVDTQQNADQEIFR